MSRASLMGRRDETTRTQARSRGGTKSHREMENRERGRHFMREDDWREIDRQETSDGRGPHLARKQHRFALRWRSRPRRVGCRWDGLFHRIASGCHGGTYGSDKQKGGDGEERERIRENEKQRKERKQGRETRGKKRLDIKRSIGNPPGITLGSQSPN